MALAGNDRIANYDWMQAIEVSSMARLAEVVARASLERTESRGAHYRDDFPEMDDKKWLRNILVRQRGGALSISSMPIESGYERQQGGPDR